MILHRAAREYYTLEIATEPTVAAWEASFDNGAAWVAGVDGDLDGTPVVRWLVAGPDATPGNATVLADSVTPLIRATDNPEIVVRSTDLKITITR